MPHINVSSYILWREQQFELEKSLGTTRQMSALEMHCEMNEKLMPRAK